MLADHEMRGGCAQHFGEIDRRLSKLEDNGIDKRLTEIEKTLSEWKGRFSGYLVAASMLSVGLMKLADYLLKK